MSIYMYKCISIYNTQLLTQLDASAASAVSRVSGADRDLEAQGGAMEGYSHPRPSNFNP